MSSKKKEKVVRAWHILSGKRLGYRDGRKVVKGRWMRARVIWYDIWSDVVTPGMCAPGMHACKTPSAARKFRPYLQGRSICLVELRGQIQYDKLGKKYVALERKVVKRWIVGKREAVRLAELSDREFDAAVYKKLGERSKKRKASKK